MRWIVTLLGARMHYAIPLILAEIGQLEKLFTDFYCTSFQKNLLNILSIYSNKDIFNRIKSRRSEALDESLVKSFNLFGIEYRIRLSNAKSESERTKVYLWAGKEFCRLVNKCNWGAANSIFAYNSAGLESMLEAKRRNMYSCLEQTIAPRKILTKIMLEEIQLWPQWEEYTEDDYEVEFLERESHEWSLADKIVCGSEYVKSALVECGVENDKCIVVPYGVMQKNKKYEKQIKKNNTNDKILNVLFVGTVCLRKGAAYILQAAKRLKKIAKIKMVGPITVSEKARIELGKYVELIGPVPRTNVDKYYEWADVFLLPSLCEGSATVTYEAMSYGLPIICTPNTGSIIRNGVDGFIIPIRDVERIVEKAELLAHDHDLRNEMAKNAYMRYKEYDYNKYMETMKDKIFMAIR